jgi:hypothetical protein
MNTFTRDQLSDLLRTGECVVEFTKVNGELRTMPCTLKAELIPPTPIVEGKTTRPKSPNSEILSVWCLDKKEWRSFRIANVISAKVKDV